MRATGPASRAPRACGSRGRRRRLEPELVGAERARLVGAVDDGDDHHGDVARLGALLELREEAPGGLAFEHDVEHDRGGRTRASCFRASSTVRAGTTWKPARSRGSARRRTSSGDCLRRPAPAACSSRSSARLRDVVDDRDLRVDARVEREGGAFADLALGGEGAAEHLRELSREREAEARALHATLDPLSICVNSRRRAAGPSPAMPMPVSVTEKRRRSSPTFSACTRIVPSP